MTYPVQNLVTADYPEGVQDFDPTKGTLAKLTSTEVSIIKAQAPNSVSLGPGGSKKMTVRNGQLYVGGQLYKGVFINAYDQFINLQTGGTFYTTDLSTIAGYGVKIIRVSLGPLTSAAWITQIGTSGTSPAAALLTNLQTFLDAANGAGLGVILTLFWAHDQVPLALTSTQADYQTPGSTTRAYMKDLATTLARTFQAHPALAAWQIGNEWFDFASVAKFAKAGNTTDTSIDHFAALIGTTNDIVTGIRLWDNDRAIISPNGGGGRYESVNQYLWIRKMLSSIGNCNVLGFHLYPDTDRSGYTHFGAGRAADLGTADLTLSMLRAAANQLGKAIIVDEAAGDDDNTDHGSATIGALSALSWRKVHAAGIELVGDWGWYADPAAYASTSSNLKVLRRDVMSLISPYNATLSSTPTAIVEPYINRPGTMPLPGKCARGSGAGNSWVRLPNNADLFHDTTATARLCMMFWLRKRATVGAAARVLACNDASTQGYLLTGNANNGLTFQMSFGGAFTTLSAGTLLYPADQPADQTYASLHEWRHIAIVWDGTTLSAPQDDGNQHLTLYMDGFVILRQALTPPKAANGTSNRNLYLLAGSDGASGFATADIFDFMIGKNFTLTSQQIVDYLRYGTVPTGIQHRWKLSGDANDSIGTLHGTAGSALTWVNNDIGNQF